MMLTIIVVSISLRTNAAKEIFQNYTDTVKFKGIVVPPATFSKRVAILMRDTVDLPPKKRTVVN